MKALYLLLLISLTILPATSSAQNINLLPEGQTLLSLSVTERVKVQQDLLVATLRIESEDSNARSLQDRINSAMEQALGKARAVSPVEISTGNYSVYQYNQGQGSRSNLVWRGSQSLTLESKDAPALLELAGELQDDGMI